MSQIGVIEDVIAYAVGPCSASVCALGTLSIADVEQALNRRHPTGIESRWTFAIDQLSFATGQPNPCPCETVPGRTHYLLHC